MKDNLNRKSIKKYLFFLVILILCYSFGKLIVENFETNKWVKESKPHTEKFMSLLAEKKFREIYDLFADKGKVSFKDFHKQINDFFKKYGEIESFQYQRTNLSYSGNPRELTGLFLHYKIICTNKKFYQGIFAVEIDENLQEPKTSSFLHFSVLARELSKENYFYLALNE